MIIQALLREEKWRFKVHRICIASNWSKSARMRSKQVVRPLRCSTLKQTEKFCIDWVQQVVLNSDSIKLQLRSSNGPPRKYRQNNSTGSTLFDSSKQQANCGTVDRWISKDLAVVYLSRGYTIPNILSRTEQDDPVVQIDGKSFPACPFFSRRGNSRRDYDLQMACSLYPYGSCHLVCVFAKFWWNSLK